MPLRDSTTSRAPSDTRALKLLLTALATLHVCSDDVSVTVLTNARTPEGSAPPERQREAPRRGLYEALSGLIGAVVGLAPHVLHHVGFLVGTAFVVGSGGTALFGSLGAVAALPLLWRLYRRFRTWRAPAIGVAVFAAMFAFSTWVIGPAINGSSGPATPSPPAGPHQGHH